MADLTALIRQHELDHTDLQDQVYQYQSFWVLVLQVLAVSQYFPASSTPGTDRYSSHFSASSALGTGRCSRHFQHVLQVLAGIQFGFT